MEGKGIGKRLRGGGNNASLEKKRTGDQLEVLERILR